MSIPTRHRPQRGADPARETALFRHVAETVRLRAALTVVESAVDLTTAQDTATDALAIDYTEQ